MINIISHCRYEHAFRGVGYSSGLSCVVPEEDLQPQGVSFLLHGDNPHPQCQISLIQDTQDGTVGSNGFVPASHRKGEAFFQRAGRSVGFFKESEGSYPNLTEFSCI